MQQNNPTRKPLGSVSEALAAARAQAGMSSVRFPGEDGGRSLAEMAQRDLDAALQLLADRAQFITGASGAAIALRRSGSNDMLCRASAGSNAPEMGALLSTEFGLSGESVRTRQVQRCDDAERDARVNHEVCRQLGIASVVVTPVVNDDEVLGVFELFSGKANAFGERDLSAVQRLSEMVETAVRLARATESLPERLKAQENSTVAGLAAAERAVPEHVAPEPLAPEQNLDDAILEDYEAEQRQPVREAAADVLPLEPSVAEIAAPVAGLPEVVGGPILPPPVVAESAPAVEAATPTKSLFWSAAASSSADGGKPAEADPSHVPPILRGLRKCEACGFPISAGRVLCVECEEKKFRGQLRTPQTAAPQTAAMPVGSIPAEATPIASTPVAAAQKPPGQALATAAQTQETPAITSAPRADGGGPVSMGAVGTVPAGEGKESRKDLDLPAPAGEVGLSPRETGLEPVPTKGETPSPDLFLSAGLERSQSWFSTNKYILGVLFIVAAVVVAVWLLR